MADQNALLAALLLGGNKFGGNTFGGAKYGGHKFGGNEFGASAGQSVNVPSSPPPLPSYQTPGQTMNTFAPMPSPAALMAQYQAGQKAQQPPVTPPQAAPVSPSVAPMSPQMPAAGTNAPVDVPLMPAPTAIGQAPGMQDPSVLEMIWNQLKQQRGGQPVPSWAQNFGNLADTKGS